MKHLLILVSVLLASLASAADTRQTLLLRQPAVSADHLAFVYAGDIWLANRDGSDPRRLTSHPAPEHSPVFSPDGQHLAFAARYESNTDIYVISVAGGQPRRLTWHPAGDSLTGWTADGSAVTFVSTRERDHGRSGQLYTVSLDGGLPAKVMEARVYRGVFDADDRRFAYIAFGSGYNGLFGGSAGWKGYRGGTTPAIRIMDMGSGMVTTVDGAESTNFNPIWLGDSLYFISDREAEQFNLYRYDGNAITKVSNEPTWDIRAAAGHGDTIVYEAGGRLMELDVSNGAATEITVRINPDLPQLRPQWKNAGSTLQAADISPTGKRVIVTARGDVFTVPTDEGSTRNLTHDAGQRQYSAIWSGDGEQVAWINESLDGQTLRVAEQTGMGEHRDYELGPHFYDLMEFIAGDDDRPARIIYSDNHLGLHSINLSNGRTTRIATAARREGFDVAVSPDNAWLAYALESPNYHRQLLLHNFASGDNVTISEASADVASPAFSQDGKYLYFAASTNSGPIQVGLNMSSQERPYRAGLYAVVLAADGASPLLPGTGDEEPAAEKDNDDEDEESADDDSATRIDLDGLSDRVVALPVAERNYGNLEVAKDGKLYYLQSVQPGASNEPPGDNENDSNAIMRFDFDEKEASKVISGVNSFSISAGGEHMLVAKTDGSLAVAEIADELKPEPVSLGGVRMLVDPREEWAQIFDETWRMEQEFFYDPDLHGLDWDAVYARYRPLVEHVGRREDLNTLLVEMIAEMQAGHNRVSGGDIFRGPGSKTGLLGANIEIDRGRYRIAKVYDGEDWNPFLNAPLATPGNSASDGEYILAINGREITASDNLFEYLQNTAGEQVILRVGPRADGRDARDIQVEPVSSERQLRLWDWIENNRRLVADATDGRVGYVYLPNTAGAGYTYFNRMFFSQLDKDAMIIDERSNGGGQAANYITDVLSRRHLSGWKDRDGLVFNTPAGALHGPKVMLIDQDAGSGGDFLPYSFRELGIGTLIGTRTWGGLIGIAVNPQLVDGGTVTVPFFRFYDTDYRWTVENEGVAPDIEVALDPVATNDGRDSQLARAISEVMLQLEEFNDPIPDQAPPYPTELGQ